MTIRVGDKSLIIDKESFDLGSTAGQELEAKNKFIRKKTMLNCFLCNKELSKNESVYFRFVKWNDEDKEKLSPFCDKCNSKIAMINEERKGEG